MRQRHKWRTKIKIFTIRLLTGKKNCQSLLTIEDFLSVPFVLSWYLIGRKEQHGRKRNCGNVRI